MRSAVMSCWSRTQAEAIDAEQEEEEDGAAAAVMEGEELAESIALGVARASC